MAKALLAKNAVSSMTVAAATGSAAKIRIGNHEFAANSPSFASRCRGGAGGRGLSRSKRPSMVRIPIEPKDGLKNFARVFDIFTAQKLKIIAILSVLLLYVTMVYGPMAAALVELFPTRIRYSGLSLPYHVGNGWFGGLLPATSFAMVAQIGRYLFRLVVSDRSRLCDGGCRLLVRSGDASLRHLRRRTGTRGGAFAVQRAFCAVDFATGAETWGG